MNYAVIDLGSNSIRLSIYVMVRAASLIDYMYFAPGYLGQQNRLDGRRSAGMRGNMRVAGREQARLPPISFFELSIYVKHKKILY